MSPARVWFSSTFQHFILEANGVTTAYRLDEASRLLEWFKLRAGLFPTETKSLEDSLPFGLRQSIEFGRVTRKPSAPKTSFLSLDDLEL